MPWIYLLVAGIFEVVWAVGLVYTQGFSNLIATCVTVLAMIASLGFLCIALKSIPLGTAYAVWTGIGATGALIYSVVFFQEPLSPIKAVFLGMILIGIIGLKFSH